MEKTQQQEPEKINLPEKKSGKGWMIATIILAIALIGMGIFGYYKWRHYKTLVGNLGAEINALKVESDIQGAKISELEAKVTKDETKPSGDQQIITAAENYALGTNVNVKSVQVKIDDKEGNFAKVNIFPAPQPSTGYFAILKKVSGSWIVVYTGNGTISKNEAAALGLPQSFGPYGP